MHKIKNVSKHSHAYQPMSKINPTFKMHANFACQDKHFELSNDILLTSKQSIETFETLDLLLQPTTKFCLCICTGM